MEDVILGIILILILVSVYNASSIENYTETDRLSVFHQPQHPSNESDECDSYIGAQEYQITFNSIVELYNSQIENKRELIVQRLHNISRFMDTDEFFDEYPYIHEYIFKI